MRRSLHCAAVAAAVALAAPTARAQLDAPAGPVPIPAGPATSCSYASCGLGIAPRLVGLDVVRGAGETRVASLSFFWPRDVRSSFAGSDAALHHAGRAVRLRRAGAALTDVGGIVLALGAAEIARHGDVRGPRAGLAIGGLALLGVSVPVQFAADGALSRAVWWYNAGLGH